MTNHLARLYVAAGTIIAFFLLWATIAAHPWATTEQVTPQDPRLIALAQREKRLQQRAADVKRVVDRRWAVYERRKARREWQNSLALQQHLRQLEASQAAAIRSAQVAVAQTAQARAYAASVVAWANQQLQTGGATTVSSSAGSTQAPASARTGRLAAPTAGRSAAPGPATVPAPGAPKAPAADAPAPLPAAPAPPAAAAPTPPAAAPAPTPAPAPATAAPPVEVVSLPPVTTTKVSKKK